ncbi:hypothetical protein B0H14DRAFT_2712833 [Mycena olivaceomarginata]|nr:hypothetical protein B0H14DRAFT_2712833 [Mycena olivaceomarginata]
MTLTTPDAHPSNDGRRRDSLRNLPSPDSEPLSDYDQALSDLLQHMSALDSCFHHELSTVDRWFLGLAESSRTACIYNLLQKWRPTSVQNRFYLSVLAARHVHEDGADRLTTTEASSLSDTEEVAKAYVMAQMYVAYHLAWAYGVLLQPLQPGSEQDVTADDERGRRRKQKKKKNKGRP